MHICILIRDARQQNKAHLEAPCKKMTEILKANGLEAEYVNNKPIEETIEIVNNSKFMISTRLHGVLISEALKTKTFALIYDAKIKTISDELKIENINILNYSKEELSNKLEKFFKEETNNLPFRKFDWEFLEKIIK